MTYFEMFCFILGTISPLIVGVVYGIYDTVSKRKANKEVNEEAEKIAYDYSASGLKAVTVQDAFDELCKEIKNAK